MKRAGSLWTSGGSFMRLGGKKKEKQERRTSPVFWAEIIALLKLRGFTPAATEQTVKEEDRSALGLSGTVMNTKLQPGSCVENWNWDGPN